MRYVTSILVIIGFLLSSGCAPDYGHEMTAHDFPVPPGDPMDIPPTSGLFSIRDESNDIDVGFTILDASGSTLTDYVENHTKLMHLLIVREDLRHFAHIHPTLGEDGMWRVPYTPPAAGTYWLYADFLTAQGGFTIAFKRDYDGDRGDYGIVANEYQDTYVDGYDVMFKPSVDGENVALDFEVNRDGQPAELQEYLGAKGHSVMISSRGFLRHLHPMNDTQPIRFGTSIIPNTFYRVFTEFQIDGKVIVVPFDFSKQQLQQ